MMTVLCGWHSALKVKIAPVSQCSDFRTAAWADQPLDFFSPPLLLGVMKSSNPMLLEEMIGYIL